MANRTENRSLLLPLDDLAKPGVRLAMGDPEAMAFGRTAMDICEKSGLKDAILKNVVVYGATVKQLALYVAQGTVDASIVGRSHAFNNREKIVEVSLPPEYFKAETIVAAVLRSSPNPELALQLAEHMSGEEAVAVFERHGFLPLKK